MLNKGLVALWNFNGNAKDNTPYNNNGTVTGATLTTDRFNNANKAYSFDGVSGNVIDVPHNSILNPSDMTISVWINPTAWSNAIATSILSKRSTTTNGWTILCIGTGTSAYLAVDFNDGTTQNRWTTVYNPPIGVWTNIVITNSSAGRILYVNGVLYLSTTPKGGVDTTSTVNLYIGKNRVSNDQFFNGKIGETRIYNRALNATEITQLYNTYSGNYKIGSLEKGLVLDMPLGDYQQGGKMADRTPYNNNGTKNGTVNLVTNRFNEANKAIELISAGAGYIDCGTNLPVTDQMTISAWVFSSQWNSVGISGVVTNTPNVGEFNYIFGVTQGGNPFAGYKSAAYNLLTHSTSLAINTWHHITMVVDAINVTIYVNATNPQSISKGNVSFSNYNTIIGNFRTNYYLGKLSDIKIWNRALTPIEIKSLYERKGLI